jgi:hypothetical protein
MRTLPLASFAFAFALVGCAHSRPAVDQRLDDVQLRGDVEMLCARMAAHNVQAFSQPMYRSKAFLDLAQKADGMTVDPASDERAQAHATIMQLTHERAKQDTRSACNSVLPGRR